MIAIYARKSVFREDSISIEKLARKTGYCVSELEKMCSIFTKQEIISFSNYFTSVVDTYHIPDFLTFWVHTSNKCCLRCSYCVIHTLGENTYMDDEEIKLFCAKIEETVKKNKIHKVNLRLAGGEPLLCWKLWKDSMHNLKKRLKTLECQLSVGIITNLVLLSKDNLKWLIDDEIGIAVSMDGLEQYQDSSRHFPNGKGSYEFVKKNLEILLNNKMTPSILTVVSNNNLDGLVDMTKFMIDLNVHFRYSFVQYDDLDVEKVIVVMKKCFDIFSDAIEKGYKFSKKFDLCDLKFLHPSIQTCSNGMTGAAVYVDGDIYFCQSQFGTTPKIGSIHDSEDLVSIIRKGTYYSEENISDECVMCRYRYICTSGCPLERVNKKDPHCKAYKELIPIMYKLLAKERLYTIKQSTLDAV